jgi:carbamoyltransferase
LKNPRPVDAKDSQKGSLLGPRFENAAIRKFLDGAGAVYEYVADEAELTSRVARLIAEEKVVGFLQGRMEFGPRALGARSIIGDARSAKMQSVMNLKIKFRESFRPFAPSVLREESSRYFDVPPHVESPYMLLVAPLRKDKRLMNGEDVKQFKGIDRLLKVHRSVVPAITHVDFSARLQTVDPDRHGRFYKVLKQFERMTQCPVIVNTSFNVRGEPIVCSPQDAYRCFMNTNMDALVLEDIILLKEKQPKARTHEVDAYLAQFELD